MLDSYLPIFVLIVLTTGFVVTMLVLSIVLGPKRFSEMKDDPFECGTIGTGDPKERLSVKFYLVAMIFILFDIEIIFLYPWAVRVMPLGWYGLWAAMPFFFVLTVGLLYVWKRGVLDWS